MREPEWTLGMMTRGAAMALVLVAATARGAAGAPLVYSACGAAADDPTRVVIAETAQGTKIVYQRAGLDPGPFETLDVNLAKVSRRLFFTLRTAHGLVEFQGRATPNALTGLLSDDQGQARTIQMPAVPPGDTAPCGANDAHP